MNPYRQEPVPDEERIQNYLSITPDMEMQMRQEMGDQPVDDMHVRMHELINKKVQHGRF